MQTWNTKPKKQREYNRNKRWSSNNQMQNLARCPASWNMMFQLVWMNPMNCNKTNKHLRKDNNTGIQRTKGEEEEEEAACATKAAVAI